MAGRRVKIGKFEHDDVKREKPDMDKFNKWKDSFMNDPALKDFDLHLWGSWPDKDTDDLDILATKGDGIGLDPQEMEEISLLNLEKSLIDAGMLVDLGFTDEKIRNFQETMDIYNKTGKPVPTNGYVYANDWYVDDEKIKDRSNWKGPFVEQLPNDMVKLGGAIPYSKQLRNIDSFDEVYSHKPIKIKSRNKSY